jgi:hypothetical protein
MLDPARAFPIHGYKGLSSIHPTKQQDAVELFYLPTVPLKGDRNHRA